MNDTIFALSSGRPPAGVAVIRLSGAQAFAINREFCGEAPLPARRAVLRHLADPADGVMLDQALVLIFPGPASFTGEDVVEWHCHGGQATVRAILAALDRLGRGARARFALREAQPGEFTRRAFEHGRIDLVQAEGLADLLAAETESQRRAAMTMAEGHFSRAVLQWRERLLSSAALVESLLDFSDEEDVAGETGEATLADAVRVAIAELQEEILARLAVPEAERLREGIRVVLAGPPNAGKSTLLNALVGRDAAIVSDIAGTTRDRIEAAVEMGGIAFLITDTAGLAEASADAIERIGIERARIAIATADIVVWLGAPDQRPRPDAICLAAQCDRPGWVMPKGADIAISALSGENMDGFSALVLARARELIPAESDYALHRRQREAMREIADALSRAREEGDLLLVAEYLRVARVAMDRLTGRSGVEDMLDALFSRFCIGK